MVALAVLGTMEARYRSLEHLPTVDDEDLDLWTAERRRASNHDPRTLVIIGKSRAQVDLHRGTIAARYPDYELVQLSLGGRGAWSRGALT